MEADTKQSLTRWVGSARMYAYPGKVNGSMALRGSRSEVIGYSPEDNYAGSVCTPESPLCVLGLLGSPLVIQFIVGAESRHSRSPLSVPPEPGEIGTLSWSMRLSINAGWLHRKRSSHLSSSGQASGSPSFMVHGTSPIDRDSMAVPGTEFQLLAQIARPKAARGR